MNPLDMTGPEFLRFYLLYGLAGLALAGVLRLLLSHGASSGDPRWRPGYYPRNEEAFGIALLRGGRKEAARTLLARLVTAGFLEVQGRAVRRSEDRRNDERNLLPLERRALQAVASTQPVREAGERVEEAVRPEFEQMEGDLERQGLALSEEHRKGYHAILAVSLLAIVGFGLVKLIVALGRGKTNVLFLILMMAVYAVAAFLLLKAPRVTRAGRRYLDWLRDSHRELMRRIEHESRGDAGEMTLAAGIFGLAVLPALAPLHAAPVEPRKEKWEEKRSDGGGCSSGGSAGCGSSGGSCSGGGGGDGGGGGCGGGGCGGCGGG